MKPKMQVTCVGNNHVKNKSSCLWKLMYTFFEFMAFYQNIDAQLCMHVKNHYHHMNYLELNYGNFFT